MQGSLQALRVRLLMRCPRCRAQSETVLLDQQGEPYICDECWAEDEL